MTRARSEAARASWTPERREKQRELAKRLNSEGKFGGRQDTRAGGRPKKHAPTAAQLVTVLASYVDTSWSADQSLLMDGRALLAGTASHLGIDRPQFENLLVSTVQAVIADGQVPEFVLVRDDGTVVAPPSKQRPAHVLRGWRNGRDARDLVVLRELSASDVRRYTDAEVIEALILLDLIATRPHVRATLGAAMGLLWSKLRVEVSAELLRRGIAPTQEGA